MIVDRIARAMTEGTPRAGFTERVMAPIHGRPRPGFTARVMSELDAPVPRPFASSARLAFVALAAVLIVLSGWYSAIQPGKLNQVQFPGVPAIAPRPYLRAALDVPPLPLDRWAPKIRAVPITHTATLPDAPASALTRATPIYRIEPLALPRAIEIAALDPPPATVAPLAEVAPLRISELRFEKENR